MTYQTLLVTVTGGVASVTLNRPKEAIAAFFEKRPARWSGR